MQTEARDAQFL